LIVAKDDGIEDHMTFYKACINRRRDSYLEICAEPGTYYLLAEVEFEESNLEFSVTSYGPSEVKFMAEDTNEASIGSYLRKVGRGILRQRPSEVEFKVN